MIDTNASCANVQTPDEHSVQSTLSHSIPARKEELQPFYPHYSSSPANRPYLPVSVDMPHLPNYSRAPQAPMNGGYSYHSG